MAFGETAEERRELGEEKGEGEGGVSKRAHLLGTRNEWIVTFMTKTIKKGNIVNPFICSLICEQVTLLP